MAANLAVYQTLATASGRLWPISSMAEPMAWTPREEVRHDVVTAGPLERLAAMLDYESLPWRAGEVPPLGHWLFMLSDARQSVLGLDGHPVRGDFMPPIAQPRRMWAGSRLSFVGTLRVGDSVTRRSTVGPVVDKGLMTFVTLRHEISANGDVAIVEEQDLVYLPERSMAEAGTPKPIDVAEAQNVRSVVADEAMLFRYSALTFNTHRIHYDLAYTTGVEHYPGLVVHGPLLATLLVDHTLRANPDSKVVAFDFRARSPVICGERFDLSQSGDKLWVRKADGTVAMTARIAMRS